jgi:nanoRNase/pAp phosphatase (c-di-AMP/oligoRNAs hydrolase)
MVDDLDIPLTYIDNLQEPPSGGYICVDTRPSFSNNSLPDDARVVGVIDHHVTGDDIGLPFEDLRTDYGAVATVVGEYLTVTGTKISENMATAITYGIIAETQDLVRFGDEADIQIYTLMLPLANQPLLGKLRHPPVELAFFRALAGALKVSRICSNVVVCHLEELNSPDELARIADVLITLEEVNWALCTGIEEDALRLSLRSSSRDAEAENVMTALVAGRGGCGGHGMMAGGRMKLKGDDVAELRKTLTDRLLNSVGTDKEAEFEPLV